MNSQEILKSLSNLEQKLQSIETARQQVERTVNAYDGARTQLVKLTQDMSSVSQEMNKVISMITTNQEALSGELSKKTDDVFKGIHTQIQNLNKETTTIKQDFASACQVAISNFVNANTANHGSGDNTSATIVYKATAKTSITHCTPATGYHLVGYYTAATDGVKVLNADGSFASSAVTDYTRCPCRY